MTIYRQGDVLIIAASDVPPELKTVPRDAGRIVLAYGEVTGHAHAIRDRHAELLAATDDDITDLFLRIVRGAATLIHEEHDTITLPPGDYVVRRQREYTPEASVWVAD